MYKSLKCNNFGSRTTCMVSVQTALLCLYVVALHRSYFRLESRAAALVSYVYFTRLYFLKASWKWKKMLFQEQLRRNGFSLRRNNLGFVLQGFNTIQCFSSTFDNSGLQYDILVYVTLFSFSNQSIWRRTAVLFNTSIFWCCSFM